MAYRGPRVVSGLRGQLERQALPGGQLYRTEHANGPGWAGFYATREGLAHVLAVDPSGPEAKDGALVVHAVVAGRGYELARMDVEDAYTERGLVRVCARLLRHLAEVPGPGAHRGRADPTLPLPFPGDGAAG